MRYHEVTSNGVFTYFRCYVVHVTVANVPRRTSHRDLSYMHSLWLRHPCIIDACKTFVEPAIAFRAYAAPSAKLHIDKTRQRNFRCPHAK